MRRTHILICLALAVVGPGCQEPPIGTGLEITRYASRNLFEAPIETRDDCLERMRYRHLAEKAWADICKNAPANTYSVHYREGFVHGFADFLYAGGNGDPPLVPPWSYRRTAYETPEGYQAMEDWFAGFRHGVQTAQASGLRSLVILPTRLPPLPPDQLPPMPRPPASPTEELPAPRKIMPPAKDADTR